MNTAIDLWNNIFLNMDYLPRAELAFPGLARVHEQSSFRDYKPNERYDVPFIAATKSAIEAYERALWGPPKKTALPTDPLEMYQEAMVAIHRRPYSLPEFVREFEGVMMDESPTPTELLLTNGFPPWQYSKDDTSWTSQEVPLNQPRQAVVGGRRPPARSEQRVAYRGSRW